MLSALLTTELFAFLLIFCRIGSAIMLLPGFGESYVSPRFRLMFALVFSLLLTPVIPKIPAIPTEISVLIVLLVGEIMVGLFLGVIARIIISATHIAGTIIALQSSLASALVQDMTQIQGQSTIISNLLGITALVLIFSFDLHHVMLKGLVSSYTTFIPGQFPIIEDMANETTKLMNGAFTAALQISAPHIVMGIIIYLGAGIVARLVPNIQVFFLLMAPQILISIFLLMITFSSIMLWYIGHFKDSLVPLGAESSWPMAEGEDQDQKTEDPTQKRLQEAFEKGNIPYSKEIANFLILSVLALTVGAFAPSILQNTKLLLIPFLADADSIQTDAAALALAMNHVILGTMSVIAIPVLMAFAAGVLARFLQSGFVISSEPISPKLSKISPLAGFKRIFSMQSVVEFIKALLKFIIVGAVGYFSVASDLGHMKQLPDSTILAMLLYMGELAIKLLVGTLIAIFFIALIDLIYQRYQHTKNLRMSKQEIKDEYKQSEGDPKIKQRLRQLRMEKAKQRMMSAVPTSDVVITNPTHYAVALQYDTKEMKAPMITAIGQDLIALKIREIAEENDIPVIENPPLARALFTSGELGKEIPIIHYEAVAKIISYVYQLKGKKM